MSARILHLIRDYYAVPYRTWERNYTRQYGVRLGKWYG